MARPEERPVRGGGEDTGQTRVLSSAEHRGVSASLAGDTVGARVDALRSDELGRINVYSRLMFVLGLVGIPVVPLLGGDPLAEKLMIGAVATVVFSYGWLYWATRRPERYNDLAVSWVSQLQATVSHGAAYFFGIFSPFPAVIAVGIYIYSLGSAFRYSLLSYLNLALGHAVLSGLTIAGVVADRGIVHAEYMSVRQQVVMAFCVQMVYGISFLVGRMSRRRTVMSLRDLEQAVRAIAQREALLHEARQELDRAARPAGPGRFTDQVLGSFRIGDVIGRGAMGEIYAAEHTRDESPAAVKVLHGRDLDGDQTHLARFVREAQVAATIVHPNVVRFLEVGEDGAPVPYLAMERLHGQDLAQVLRERRRLRLGEVIDLVEQIAGGLEAARRSGIVHRDLKPRNLFLSGSTWKILDFGISKLVADSETITRGMVVGTPSYMAPEQASGRTVDHRADVYSLAVIAYRALTGQPAFSGSQVPQVLYDVVHRMPGRPGSLVDLPADVDAVMAIGLAKRPEDRFERAGDLARHFGDACRGQLSPMLRQRAERLLARMDWGTVRP